MLYFWWARVWWGSNSNRTRGSFDRGGGLVVKSVLTTNQAVAHSYADAKPDRRYGL
jgi:hypothetical protein